MQTEKQVTPQAVPRRVFPRLQPDPVYEVVQGFPEVVRLVAVVNQVHGRGRESGD